MREIRQAETADFEQIWPFFQEIVSAGETYTYPPDICKEDAQALWMTAPRKTFVVVEDGKILGSYYIKTNQSGGGSHICNCGYMVSASARGRGIASIMCEHSQMLARDLGYLAMQFNFVVSTNTEAVRLWQKMGFEIVGEIPRAFQHPRLGFVSALVMYKQLT
ncbi:GNAT family N-acetyltransferase [Undibacterium fentianense]|uniref:GNAT family N-acetyltransferase n=1 Tax=Undibacterium fentianense TaxID=2828728 RepID=A0A941IG34_9BURK|nr:GNAT family N-acetyltransferase [Undibacterium fentianense]MBR7800972.1 GNAT family N-acetyltransferase [Undibacterium fentianense]